MSISITTNLKNCTATYTDPFDGASQKFTCDVTANDGYSFLFGGSITRFTFKYESDSSTDYKNLTRASDYKTAYLHSYSIGEAISSGTLKAWAYPDSYTLTENLVNCTCDITELPTNTDTTITLTADSNASFTERPILKYTYSDGTSETEKFTLSTDSLTATLTTNTGITSADEPDVITSITISATANKETVNVPITKTLENCTSDIPDEIEEGASFTWTLTASDDYLFYKAPLLYKTDSAGTKYSYSFTMSSDYKTATYTGTATSPNLETTIASISVSASTVSQIFTVNKTLENCTSDIPDTIKPGETLTITCTANDGYYFTSAPILTYKDYDYGDSYDSTFELTSDGLTATLENFTLPTDTRILSTSIALTASAEVKTIYVDKYGSIHIYKVTVDNLTEFAESRFSDSEGNSIDMGDYVPDINRIYINVGETLEDTLKVGTYDLNTINVETPLNDIIITDCGKVTIEAINNNAVDYLSQIKIFLPFIGMENLDIDFTMSHELHLYYKTCIVNGESIAVLEVDGIQCYSWECKVAQTILYRTNSDDKNISDYEFSSQFLYDMKPFIYLIYNTATNENDVYTKNAKDFVYNMSGFFTMINTQFLTSDTMLETEKDEILSLLKEGVYYE